MPPAPVAAGAGAVGLPFAPFGVCSGGREESEGGARP